MMTKVGDSYLRRMQILMREMSKKFLFGNFVKMLAPSQGFC